MKLPSAQTLETTSTECQNEQNNKSKNDENEILWQLSNTDILARYPEVWKEIPIPWVNKIKERNDNRTWSYIRIQIQAWKATC